MHINGLTTILPALPMTPLERRVGRFLRDPNSHPNRPENGDEELDSEDEEEEDDGQSGDADDDNEDTGDGDDEDAEDADNDDEGSRQDDRPKRRLNGYEKRIARLTRENAELREKAGDGKRGDGGNVSATPKKPVVADFDTYEEFIEALGRFTADEQYAAHENRRNARTAQQEFAKTVNNGKKAYRDWDDVVTDDVEVTPYMSSAIQNTDNPADVMYFLGSNTEEAERIAALPAGKQAIAIAKIDARFDKKKEGKPGLRSVSSAPAPITPIKTGSGGVKKEYEKMSADEFAEARNRELRAKKG